MIVPVILLVLLLLLLIVSYGVYRFVLYAPLGQQNDPFHLPNGPQRKVADAMMAQGIV